MIMVMIIWLTMIYTLNSSDKTLIGIRSLIKLFIVNRDGSFLIIFLNHLEIMAFS